MYVCMYVCSDLSGEFFLTISFLRKKKKKHTHIVIANFERSGNHPAFLLANVLNAHTLVPLWYII